MIIQNPNPKVNLISYLNILQDIVPDSQSKSTSQYLRDSSVEALLSNVSSENKQTKKFLHSVSITAAANVNDEIHLQKYRSDTETSIFDNPVLLRSKSTIETSKDLKNRIKLTNIKKIRNLHEEAYGKRLTTFSPYLVPT